MSTPNTGLSPSRLKLTLTLSLFAVLSLFAAFARGATTYVCTAGSCKLSNSLPDPADTVLTANSDVGSGPADFLQNSTAVPFSTLAPTALVGACDNNWTDAANLSGCVKEWERKSVLFPNAPAPSDPVVLPPNLPPFVFKGFDCAPADGSAWGVKDEPNHIGAIWWNCDTGTEIISNFFCGDPAKLNQFGTRLSAANVIALLTGKIARDCTAAEKKLLDDSFYSGNRLYARPTKEGAPTYFATANGTVGSKSKALTSLTDECNWRMRLHDSNGLGNSYYAIVGRMDNGKAIYGSCTLSAPVTKIKPKTSN